MFWDKIACFYDVFANIINRETNIKLCSVVNSEISSTDDVLECACGTGLLTRTIGKKCNSLIATDYSIKMLKIAGRKLKKHQNIKFECVDIMKLPYPNNSFDKVIAGNVIHLLDDPIKAIRELDRVCKLNGKIIIPTYMNKNSVGNVDDVSNSINKLGVDFKRKFNKETYMLFFKELGYQDVSYIECIGRIPCMVAVIKKSSLCYSSTNCSLPTPHKGQIKSSGTSSHLVPGSMPPSG